MEPSIAEAAVARVLVGCKASLHSVKAPADHMFNTYVGFEGWLSQVDFEELDLCLSFILGGQHQTLRGFPVSEDRRLHRTFEIVSTIEPSCIR